MNMMLGALIFFPFVAALAVLFSKENAKRIALGAAVIEFALCIWMTMQFNPAAGTQFTIDYAWIPALGIRFHTGIDGISLLLVLLTTFLLPIIILSAFKQDYKNAPLFFALILAMEMALVGVFVALDGFLFYVFWELALIPIY